MDLTAISEILVKTSSHFKFRLTCSPLVRFVSNFSSNMSDNCDPNGKFAFIVHGWNESINTTWVADVIANLLKARGGCVFFMDYSVYSINPDYFALVNHKVGIINVLLKKMQQTGHLDQVYCFGFSFGARVCPAAGKLAGNQVLERMDLCDRAGKSETVKREENSKLFLKVMDSIITKIQHQLPKTLLVLTRAPTREHIIITVIRISEWDITDIRSLLQDRRRWEVTGFVLISTTARLLTTSCQTITTIAGQLEWSQTSQPA